MNITNIIHRFFTSKATQEEQDLLKKWKDESVQNIEELQQIVKLQSLDMQDYRDYDSASAWEKLDSSISRRDADNGRVVPMWSRYAAAAVMLLVASVGVYYFVDDTKVAIQAQKASYVTTDLRKEINLADGSMVNLDVSSDMEVVSARNVKLSGRAYFNIAKNKERAFTISTHTGVIKVLGTAFSVVSDSSLTEIYVTEGSVQYSDDTRSVILGAGDYIKYDGRDIVKINKDQGNYLSWYTRKLRFRNTTLATAVRDIEYLYGVDIEIASNIRHMDCRVTATYKDKSVREVLDELRNILGLKFNKKGKTIVIVDAKC